MVTICGWVNFLGLKGPEKLGKTRQAASYAIWANSVADLVVRDMLRLSAKRRGFHQSRSLVLIYKMFLVSHGYRQRDAENYHTSRLRHRPTRHPRHRPHIDSSPPINLIPP